MRVGKDTVVVITGASGGVGRATARLFGRRGAKLGLLARGRDGLEAARREVEAEGGHALALPTDVAHYDEVEAAAATVERELGPIDVWINNAMVSMYSPFMHMHPDEFRHIVEVTLLGQVHGTRAALDRMVPRDRGVIVQVGSALAFRSVPLQSAYCASKHAIQGFTESLWSELIHEGSRVHLTVVNLPALNTTQFTWTKSRMPRKARPTGKIYQPEVAADAILFAAEHDRREVMVGGSTVKATLGEKVLPGWLDHKLAKQAWDGAMLPEPEVPGRPDNFWQPLAGDHGAHGTFDDMAKPWSFELWLDKHRWGAAAGLATVLMAVGLGLGARWR